MERKYGIVFRVSRNKDKFFLFPKSVIYGNEYDLYLQSKKYSYLKPSYDNLDDGEYEIYGFGVTQEELISYYGLFVDDDEITESNLKKFYLIDTSKYFYILDKSNNCYAVNVEDRSIDYISIEDSFLEFIYQKEIMKTSLDAKFLEEKPLSKGKMNINDIFNAVTKRVVAQDDPARSVISVIYKNLMFSEYEGMKSNILLYGPSGCGKTEIVKSIAKYIDIPMICVNATSYTANGYVGDTVNNMIKLLFEKSNRDLDKVSNGVIVIDEFDKLADTDDRNHVNKTDVQNELLKIIEGTNVEISVPVDAFASKKYVVDTSKITFILVGAFSSIYEKRSITPIGFERFEEKEESTEIQNDNLTKYGIINEIVGRLPVKIAINNLDENDYVNVINNSSISNLKIYEEAFKNDLDTYIIYKDKDRFVKAVASKAYSLGVGVRGIKTVVDEIMLNAIFSCQEVGGGKILQLSDESVENPKKYVLRKRSDNIELSGDFE